MEVTRQVFDEIAPPGFTLNKVITYGRLVINGSLQLRYRLLTLPKLNERDVWACRIATRLTCDGEEKFLEERIEWDGGFLIHHSNLLGEIEVWRMDL
jgi:hypothetical protein